MKPSNSKLFLAPPKLRKNLTLFSLILFSAFLTSCASTGPSVSKAELKGSEEEFNLKFLKASEKWLPKIYRVGYTLITSHVPGHGDETPRFGFTGVGVDDLKDYARKAYGIPKNVKGVLVLGTYPGSKAENVDVQLGDVLLSLNGKKTKNLGSYFKRMRQAKGDKITAKLWRKGQTIERDFPVEKVYYNAQFFLAPTPHFDAHAAFSKISVGIGALRYCRNDDELAVVMGHELAHTTLRHSLKELGTGLSTSIGYGLAAGVINAVTFPGVGSVLMAPLEGATDAVISRRYEREADYYGMKHAFHAGYDVQNGSKIFSRLATDAPSFSLLAYTFASHPKSSERFLRLQKIVEEFKTNYPDRFPMHSNPEWEVAVPLQSGESLEEAVSHLLENKPQTTPTPAAVPAPKAA